MILHFGDYVLDVDMEKTRAYHQSDHRITCDCMGCRNFDHAVPRLPHAVHQFFEEIGVDPAKPEVVSIDYAPSKETMAYSGFYYLCGTVLQGKEAWIKDDEKHFHFDETCLLQISDDFAVYFAKPLHGIVNPDFPKPIIELQYICTLPWLMEEPHSYHYQLGDVEHA